MKDRSIRVLLICVVLLGSFIALQEYWRSQEKTRKIGRSKTFDIDVASLSVMEFQNTNAVVKCAKENGLWMVGNSDRGMGRADVALLYELVTAFNSTTNSTTITAKQLSLRGLDASEYGFDPPVWEITAVDNQGRHQWQIGRTTPLGNEVYIKRVNEDEIHTIPSMILGIIPMHPDLLRDRVLFTAEAAGVKRVEIRGPVGFVRIVKEAPAEWRIQQPIVATADSVEVMAYIDTLCKIRVEEFFEENVSDFSAYGLQSEARQISLGNTDGSSRTLVLGDAIPGRPGLVYARRADDTSVFALKEDVLKLLNVTHDLFRDARVLTLPKDAIDAVSMKYGDQELNLDMDGSGAWQITSPVAWDADASSVNNLIDLWSSAVITDFGVETNAGVSDWVFEFSSAKSDATNRIEVLQAGDRKDGLFVRVNGDPDVFQINLPMLPDSIVNPLIYKDHLVWTLNRKDVGKLALQLTDRPRQVVALNADGEFVATESSANPQVQTDAVNRTIERLCNLTTPEYLAYNPRNLDIYGLSNPFLELYIGLVGSEELGRVLLVGRQSTDGFYSMVKGRDVVFYLDPETVDILSSDLIAMPEGAVQVAE